MDENREVAARRMTKRGLTLDVCSDFSLVNFMRPVLCWRVDDGLFRFSDD